MAYINVKCETTTSTSSSVTTTDLKLGKNGGLTIFYIYLFEKFPFKNYQKMASTISDDKKPHPLTAIQAKTTTTTTLTAAEKRLN